MDVPSMVQRSGDTLIVRSVVSGNQLFMDQEPGALDRFRAQQYADLQNHNMPDMGSDSKDEELPQCKIKRNYSCGYCTYFTQNPRCHLTHLRDVHGEKIVINKCKLCLYASRHYQKLVRHMKMVHGSTEGIEDNGQARKRQMGRDARKRKIESTEMTHLIRQHISQPQQSPVPMPQQFPIAEKTPPPMPLPLQRQHSSPVPKSESPIPVDDNGPNRILKCSVCDFTTLYREVLVEHEREQHYKTKFFRCEKCTYVTHIKARFSKHVKYHSMPMIKCNACDFRTPYKWNLDRHMKNHGGSGTFKCAACDFTADIKQSLTVHEMNHHVPPVGNAAGMNLARRRNRVGGSTDLGDDFLSDTGDMDLDPLFNNNNNIDDFEEHYAKKGKYDDEDQPTDLSQKGSNLDLASIGMLKKQMRPVPNLIPIQPTGNSAALNLSKDLPESTNSIKEIANLLFPEIILREKPDGTQLSPSSTHSASKKKGSNVFDKLKESFADESGRNENLICNCGYISKCLSESFIHRKSCNQASFTSDDEKHSSPSPINLTLTTSTRCQYCRHRCKSSADLINHLKNCLEAGNCPNDSYDSMSGSSGRQDYDDEMDDIMKHPMENRVFVWNKMPDMSGGSSTHSNQNGSVNGDSPGKKSLDLKNEDNRYYGVETAPGYGEVTKKMSSEEEATNSSLKKVYKCPHCSFWASTASRFHVHIVGHLNQKPFECSLCAYRSNWRWDITKHIRLKTIRDPGHKNANVLMNDETGRRNYTKYNKYITLMKVTEEDGDPKLMKSGEMTPNQEASLAFLNDYKNAAGKYFGADSDSAQNEPSSEMMCNNNNNNKNIDQNGLLRILQSSMEAGHAEHSEKRSPPPLIKPSDDLITDVKTDGNEKKTFYKCRKCNFKNSNRDAVLAHVKMHYQMAAPLQVAVNQNAYNVFAAMCLSQQSPLALVAGDNSAASHPLLASGLLQQAITSSPNLGPTSPARKLLSNAMVGAMVKSEHGETDEASSSVVVGGATSSAMTATTSATSAASSAAVAAGSSSTSSGMLSGTGSGTAVMGQLTTVSNINTENDWRGPAPYRCGHCHQVSNWKHVIQRHCRLKHAGDIRIETVDRTSDRLAPMYRPLTNGQSQNPPPQSLADKSPTKSQQLATPESVLMSPPQQTSFDELLIQKFSPDVHILTVDDAPSKSKQQQCPLCPFISESKSQMNYHISLHKGNQYECNLCGFICAKKQQLSAHNRACHEEDNSPHSAYMKSLGIMHEEIRDEESTLFFCSKCPSRFQAVADLQRHSNQHSAGLQFKCEACDFSTKVESNLLEHSFAHTSAYQNKTERLCKSHQESVEFPCPNIRKMSLPNTGTEFWVVRSPSPGESLLKKQLETGTSKPDDSPPAVEVEKCLYCPFDTTNADSYKAHLQNHFVISKIRHEFKCDHCDFSVKDEAAIKDHIKLHFKAIHQNKVSYFTSYENLELSVLKEDAPPTPSSEQKPEKVLVYKSALQTSNKPIATANRRRSSRCSTNNNHPNNEESGPPANHNHPQQRTILVDAKTGQVISRN